MKKEQLFFTSETTYVHENMTSRLDCVTHRVFKNCQNSSPMCETNDQWGASSNCLYLLMRGSEAHSDWLNKIDRWRLRQKRQPRIQVKCEIEWNIIYCHCFMANNSYYMVGVGLDACTRPFETTSQLWTFMSSTYDAYWISERLHNRFTCHRNMIFIPHLLSRLAQFQNSWQIWWRKVHFHVLFNKCPLVKTVISI